MTQNLLLIFLLWHNIYIYIYIHLLLIPDIGVRKECVLLVWVEEGEVLHDDGDEQVEHDVRDDQVERAEEQQSAWVNLLIFSFIYYS